MGRAALAGHVGDAEVETFGHTALDQLDGDDRLGLLLDEVLEELLDLCRRDVPIVQGGPGGDAVQRAFQTADVGFHALGNEMEDGLTEPDLHGGRLFSQDGHAGLHVG